MSKLQFGRNAATAAAALAAALGVACGDAVGPLHAEDLPMSGPVAGPIPPTGSNPFAGVAFFIDVHSNARRTADAWRATRPADAAQMEKLAESPQAKWFGGWNSDVRADVDRAVASAASANAIPVLVAYNIPQRDCGSYSAGGAGSPDAYRRWIGDFARGLAGRRSVVILEPDALAGMDCLSGADQSIRTGLLAYAVTTLRELGAVVYLDAGHSRWQPAATMAGRLEAAGIGHAAGFALNVSNFHPTDEQISYGNGLSAAVGGRHYVIDTSRNGLGSAGDSQWCNPEGRALGERPTNHTGQPLVDAFLWVKTPGESDGACNGAPSAGTWMPEYALGLARRAAY